MLRKCEVETGDFYFICTEFHPRVAAVTLNSQMRIIRPPQNRHFVQIIRYDVLRVHIKIGSK